MGTEKNPRRVAENEAMAKLRMLKTSPQKLNLVATMIRGKKVEKALSDLTFSKRRIAVDVKKCLQSAIANAENNHGLDVDELVVAEAYVGKNITLKRGRPRAGPGTAAGSPSPRTMAICCWKTSRCAPSSMKSASRPASAR
jgi:large subunit ribosomal protein L22